MRDLTRQLEARLQSFNKEEAGFEPRSGRAAVAARLGGALEEPPDHSHADDVLYCETLRISDVEIEVLLRARVHALFPTDLVDLPRARAQTRTHTHMRARGRELKHTDLLPNASAPGRRPRSAAQRVARAAPMVMVTSTAA